MLGRHDAIFGVEEDNIIGAAGLLPEDKSSPWVTPRAIQAYDELLDTCLEKLPLLATSRDTAALINSFSNAIRAENLQFDQRLGEAEREASCEPPTIHAPPQWVQNSFLLASELYQREKDPGVKEVLSGMVSMLADSGERLRALLVQYSVVKPSLQATVLGLIEEKSFVSSPVTIADEVHETVKALLPPEVTHSIHTMINYLADDYAIQNDVLGYKVGEGVCKDRSKS
jgi:hypothetical protein